MEAKFIGKGAYNVRDELKVPLDRLRKPDGNIASVVFYMGRVFVCYYQDTGGPNNDGGRYFWETDAVDLTPGFDNAE